MAAAARITLRTVLEHMHALHGDLSGQIRALNGRVGGLEGRMDGLESRIDRMEANLSRQIDAIDKRLDAIEIEKLPARVRALERRFQS